MSVQDKKRERDNKISKLMGEYLLKGYKMLGSTCNACGTILLKDRQQQDYCIGCNEVDVNPMQIFAISPKKLSPENQPECSNDEAKGQHANSENVVPSKAKDTVHNSTTAKQTGSLPIKNAILKLQERLAWATNQLGNANSIEVDIKLCELISSCGHALRTLKDLQE